MKGLFGLTNNKKRMMKIKERMKRKTVTRKLWITIVTAVPAVPADYTIVLRKINWLLRNGLIKNMCQSTIIHR